MDMAAIAFAEDMRMNELLGLPNAEPALDHSQITAPDAYSSGDELAAAAGDPSPSGFWGLLDNMLPDINADSMAPDTDVVAMNDFGADAMGPGIM